MKVVHVSTYVTGGAGIAAFRLHQGLKRVGVDSSMVAAGSGGSDDENVAFIHQRLSIPKRLRRRLKQYILTRKLDSCRSTRATNQGIFSDDRASAPKSLIDALPCADIYNLHWVAGLVDFRAFFPALNPEQRIVWTLHDMNPFTGGCHYAFGCDRFVDTCGSCPALGSDRATDLSSAVLNRKRRAFNRLRSENIRIAAPSVWMARQASRSSLFRAFQISNIPYGLDTDVFMPRNKASAREILGIPQELKLIMFVAALTEDHRKGIDLLAAALKELCIHRDVGVATVGWGRLKLPGRHFSIGGLSNERMLSQVYSAADLFVCSTREDNLPNVVLEAMACGIPVVGFDVGGLADVVRPGENGFLAPKEDVRALCNAIGAILDDDACHARMSHAAREIAVREYRLELQAQRYLRLYDELLTKHQH
jgi:glycosyltransferase involved in cell wall biosynthesis